MVAADEVAAVSAVVVADEAVVAEAAADVEDKPAIDEGNNNENKAKLHDFVEIVSNRCCDHYLQLSGCCGAGGVRGQTRCRSTVGAEPESIRHTKAGSG